ncbi:MAG TPA: hypothetical protein VGK71_05265 [Nitrospirota bacterium]
MDRGEEYRTALALVNNPRTPRRTALGLIRQLRPRDMAFLTRNKAVPTEIRQACEALLREKMQGMPLGVKITLARMVSEDVVKSMLLNDEPNLIKACFENPALKETTVIWLLNHRGIPARVIAFIAGHPKWSAQYHVRFALVRNSHTPFERASEFVHCLKGNDLRFLYNDPTVAVALKVEIEINLERKGQPLAPPRDEGRVIGMPEDAGDDFSGLYSSTE